MKKQLYLDNSELFIKFYFVENLLFIRFLCFLSWKSFYNIGIQVTSDGVFVYIQKAIKRKHYQKL